MGRWPTDGGSIWQVPNSRWVDQSSKLEEDAVFAVWRTNQHFSVPGSLPDATSESLDKVLAASTGIPQYGSRGQFIGKWEHNAWFPVGFAENGQLRPTTPGQSRTYDRVRSGRGTWSSLGYGQLTDGDHPRRTVNLDEEGGLPSGGTGAVPRPVGGGEKAEEVPAAVRRPQANSIDAPPASRTADGQTTTTTTLSARQSPDPRSGPASLEEALDLMRALVGVELRTATGGRKVILGVEGHTADVRTDRSPEGEPVPAADLQRGIDRLRQDGMVRVHTDVLGHHRAFIGAVLATLPGASLTRDPARITLATTIPDAVAQTPYFSILDGITQVKFRKEQGMLRSLLLKDHASGDCCICGLTYPAELLVAAHIKRRSLCSAEERNDLTNVAMLACVFGCDALYEVGYLSVSGEGVILVTDDPDGRLGAVTDRLAELAGKTCSAFTDVSADYFAWHRESIFREPN
jgi:hypothetical protein